ncbi:MAG: hypothetical protein PVSMB7_19020 [Chloroflexota bacterium]
MSAIRHIFLESIPVVRAAVTVPAVATHWNDPSALSQMSVGALAAHLGRAVLTVDTYLDAPVPEKGERGTAVDYLRGAVGSPEWADISSSFNVAIRGRAEQQAANGPGHLAGDLDEATRRLQQRLPREPDDRTLAVAGAFVISVDEYLKTRLVEIAVHIDDLAASVQGAAPDLPSPALRVASDLLIDVARSLHGDRAVLRALSRRERDTRDALRVL